MAKTKSPEETETPASKMKCGIVMPIAGFDGYSSDHWKDVKEIIIDAAEKAGFDANIVSYANESTVIHKTIIQNLYDNEIVVVDVSGKNPNVMFELGMRLAFDKPTIVIKDDLTNYSFDTSPIEHLGYPSSLHYQSIKGFKELLSKKIEATYKASQQEGYSSFLKNFGEFTVAHLQKTAVSESEFFVNQLKDLIREFKPKAKDQVLSSFENDLEISSQSIKHFWQNYLKSQSYPIETVPTNEQLANFSKWLPNNAPSSYADELLQFPIFMLRALIKK